MGDGDEIVVATPANVSDAEDRLRPRECSSSARHGGSPAPAVELCGRDCRTGSHAGPTRGGALPSGTVTFAFTDIEGSTPRWERDRRAMQAAVRRHDVLMRSAIAEHGGHIFKTIGDAFCGVFARPDDAVAAMLAAQRALAAEDFSSVGGIRVRAAILTGMADERDGDYFGPAVNRIARLLAIGHGGQVLVSGATSDLVQGMLAASASLRDLGEHRLKDLARAERVYQLVAPGLAMDLPPLRSLDVPLNNLPPQLTSFLGRDREVVEVAALLERHPLVTLIGTGGIGKTRISLQVAANLFAGSRDGVWFIELAPLRSGDYIAATVARVLGLKLASGRRSCPENRRRTRGQARPARLRQLRASCGPCSPDYFSARSRLPTCQSAGFEPAEPQHRW